MQKKTTKVVVTENSQFTNLDMYVIIQLKIANLIHRTLLMGLVDASVLSVPTL